MYTAQTTRLGDVVLNKKKSMHATLPRRFSELGFCAILGRDFKEGSDDYQTVGGGEIGTGMGGMGWCWVK